MTSVPKKSPLITIDGAAALAKERGLALSNRWWRRQIEADKIEAVAGVVPYLRLALVERVIDLVSKGQALPKRKGKSHLEAGQEAEFGELAEPSDVA